MSELFQMSGGVHLDGCEFATHDLTPEQLQQMYKRAPQRGVLSLTERWTGQQHTPAGVGDLEVEPIDSYCGPPNSYKGGLYGRRQQMNAASMRSSMRVAEALRDVLPDLVSGQELNLLVKKDEVTQLKTLAKKRISRPAVEASVLKIVGDIKERKRAQCAGRQPGDGLLHGDGRAVIAISKGTGAGGSITWDESTERTVMLRMIRDPPPPQLGLFSASLHADNMRLNCDFAPTGNPNAYHAKFRYTNLQCPALVVSDRVVLVSYVIGEGVSDREVSTGAATAAGDKAWAVLLRQHGTAANKKARKGTD